MIIDFFIKDTARLSMLSQAQSILHQINAFGMLLELASQRSAPLPSAQPIENAALRSAWHDGYVEALNDIAHFSDRYLQTASEKVKPDFSAKEALVNDGTITEKEYEQLRKQQWNSAE